MALRELQNLRVEFGAENAPFTAVDGLDLTIDAGEVIAIIGESRSGKSVSSLTLIGLVDYPWRVRATRMAFDGRELQTMNGRKRASLLGKDIAMIFQDLMTSLNPRFTVAYQLIETLRAQEGGSKSAMRKKALQLLRQVDIPDPERRLDAYPHQLSGGMSQRVMVAMAIACNPRLLIVADEPVSALDVSIQAQVLNLRMDLQDATGVTYLFISHNLAVVEHIADEVMVMYLGKAVEHGSKAQLFARPLHPYTRTLLSSTPRIDPAQRQKKIILAGELSSPMTPPPSHLVLPTIALGTIPLAVVARVTRSSMREALREDYVRTARAKGLSHRRVVGVHALIPVITGIGLQVGTLLARAILTEAIFSWPGIGKWLVEAIRRRDYPVVQGGIRLSVSIIILVSLVVDVLYGVINPRIRHRT